MLGLFSTKWNPDGLVGFGSVKVLGILFDFA
jgi:hypothetical protein